VDATVIVSIAGLTATTTLGLAVPIITAHFADRNARRAKARELALAVYIDAMAYVQLIKAGIDHLVDPSGRRPAQYANDHANVDLITARLRLVAPDAVIRPWVEFVNANDSLSFYIRESGDYREIEHNGMSENAADIVTVRKAAHAVAKALRAAVDSSAASH